MRHVSLLFLMFFIGHTALAGEHTANLLDAYQMATVHNPSLAAAQARRRQALEVRVQAQAQWLPTLRAGAAYQHLASQGGGAGGGNYQAPRVTASLRQPLFDAPRWYRLDAASHEAERAEHEHALASSEVALEVAQAYGQALKAEVVVAGVKREVNGLSQHLAFTRARLKSGMATLIDLAETRAALDQAQAQQSLAYHELAAAHEQLQRLTGLSVRRLQPLRPGPMPIAAGTREAWVSLAMERSPQIQHAEAQVNVATAALNEARGAHAPTLEAVMSYSHSDLSGLGNRTTPGLSQTLWAVEFNLPLFEGGGTQSRVRAALAALQAAEHERDSLRRKVTTQVSIQHGELLAAERQVLAYQQSVSSALRLLEATRVGRDLGTRHTQDVIDAERRWYGAQRQHEHARLDVWMNVMKLKQLVSPLTYEAFAELNTYLVDNTS
jgi:outer membrane protein